MITRKIRLIPIGEKEEINKAYSYLRDGIKAQNSGMNECITALYSTNLMGATKEDRKELYGLYSRISTSKKGSGYDPSIQFPKGLPTASDVLRKVKSDFDKSVKDGLMFGKVSLPTYTMDNPLIVHVNYCNLRKIVQETKGKNTGIFHNYENDEEFFEHLYKKDLEVLLQFSNNILFKLYFGESVSKSSELRSVIGKIFKEEYTIHGSQIQLEKRKNGRGDDIYIYLAIEVPVVEHELDENTVVGVDLGVATPAVCALNNKYQPREYIGDGEIFIHHKQKYNNERKRLQKNLTLTNSGHGRKKKLKAMDRLKKSESNFTTSYAHKVSRKIVDFAIKNNAKYINLENLSGIDTSNSKLLGVWKYYELQQFVEYKAKQHGIIVRKINPYHTSQTCSACGHWEDGQRDGRNFCCKACGVKLNADYNAARNIAMTEDFVKDK